MALGPDVLSGKGAAATNSGTPFPITPNDSNDLAYVTRMVTINVGGTITVDTIGPDGAVAQSNIQMTVPAGSYPWRISRVYATGTAATGITGTR